MISQYQAPAPTQLAPMVTPQRVTFSVTLVQLLFLEPFLARDGTGAKLPQANPLGFKLELPCVAPRLAQASSEP